MRVLLLCQWASLAAIPLMRLLVRSCGLKNLATGETPLPDDPETFVDFVRAGHFAEHSVMLRHFSPSGDMIAAADSIGCRVVVVTRNPYDAFLVMLHLVNNNRKPFEGTALGELAGKPSDDPAVFDFIRDHYRAYAEVPRRWLNECPGALRVRYEDLMREPLATLQAVNDRLGPVPGAKAQQAIREWFSCLDAEGRAEASFDISDYEANCLLSAEHIGALNAACGDIVTELGYRLLPESAAAHQSDRLAQYSRFYVATGALQRFLLIGFGKSGTTWLHMMLFKHPQTLTVSERKLIETPDQNQALLKPLFDDAFFMDWFASSSFGIVNPQSTDVRHDMARLISDYLLLLQIRKQHIDWRNTKRLVTHVGEKIAFNKAEDAGLILENIARVYPGIKIIHIVRDPRDVAVSALYHQNRNALRANRTNWMNRSWVTRYIESVKAKGPENHKERGNLEDFLARMAREWHQSMDHFQSFRERSGDLYTVRYEDLLADTAGELSKLLDFADLNSTADVVEEIIHRTSFKQLSGGRTEGQEDTSSFYRKGVSGDWQNHFSSSDDALFIEYAKPFMQRYRYIP